MIGKIGIAEIESLEDAQAAWEGFFGRFFSPEIPEDVDVSFNAELRKFTPREGYDVYLMSVASFNQLNTPGEKPYLIKDDQGKYQIWGYKENKWQLTDLGHLELNFEWKQNQNIFISPKDKIFNALKKGHTPEGKHNAKYQHPLKRRGRTYHSDDFDDFLNGNQVTIPDGMSLTQKSLDIVEEAIREGNYEAPCFSDKSHLFYALWLFKQNKITRQQFTTILARAQVIRAGTPIKKMFRIVDEQGQFTEEAKTILLPILKNSAYGGGLTDWHLERFRLLMQAAPKSEQIFYISKSNPGIISEWGNQLGDALERNKAWYVIRAGFDAKEDTHLSFGAIEGLQIATSGIYGAAANRAKIGKVDINTVKEGVEYFYRPTAISIAGSGVEATTKGIHDYAYSPMPAVTVHDVFHARLHNTIPPEFHMMLNHMYYLASQHTKLPWSKVLWELMDREFHRFQYRSINLDSPQLGAKLFVELFSSPGIQYDHPLLIDGTLSDEGVAIVWNMVNQPEIWKKLYKVDIDSLGEPYKKHIIKMKGFAQKFEDDKDEHPKLINLKYRLFRTTSTADYQQLKKLIDSLKEDLLNNDKGKLLFGKTKTNRVVLKFGIPKGETYQIITENTAKNFIPILADKYLFQGVNNQLIQQELNMLSPKWGSIHKGHQISKENIDVWLQKFSSFGEKLRFLEKCCEEILKSDAYTRRHATIDNMFSFLKNPLTTSQRQHVRLLQEKMQELINERVDELKDNQEELDEFKWLMENRDSKLAHLSTKRFYLHLDFFSTAPFP